MSRRWALTVHGKACVRRRDGGLADRLIYPGSVVGPGICLLAIASTVLTVASNAALRRDPRAKAAAGLALAGSAILIDDPNLLAWALLAAALTAAALLPRTTRFDDAWV